MSVERASGMEGEEFVMAISAKLEFSFLVKEASGGRVAKVTAASDFESLVI